MRDMYHIVNKNKNYVLYMIHNRRYQDSPEDELTEFGNPASFGRSEPPLHRFNRLRLAPYVHMVTAFASLGCNHVTHIVALNH